MSWNDADRTKCFTFLLRLALQKMLIIRAVKFLSAVAPLLGLSQVFLSVFRCFFLLLAMVQICCSLIIYTTGLPVCSQKLLAAASRVDTGIHNHIHGLPLLISKELDKCRSPANLSEVKIL